MLFKTEKAQEIYKTIDCPTGRKLPNSQIICPIGLY